MRVLIFRFVPLKTEECQTKSFCAKCSIEGLHPPGPHGLGKGCASVAGPLVTTEAMVAEKPRKDAARPIPAGAGREF